MLLEANRLLCILERTHVVFKRISRLLHINCFSCLNSSVMKKKFCAKRDVMQQYLWIVKNPNYFV